MNNQISTTTNSNNTLSNIDMMTKISQNQQSLEDIKTLTSSRVKDQLKVFLISQARNELSRVVKLTQFLDKLEDTLMQKVNDSIATDSLTLKQYGDIINLITDLLARSNEIILKVLQDDSLMTILNTTIYSSDTTIQKTSVIASLKDPQSRERVRSVISTILQNTEHYVTDIPNEEDDLNEV